MIEFTAKPHAYKLHGKPVMSVTEVIEFMRLLPDYPQAQREFYLARGDAIHRGTALHDAGKLRLIDEQLEGFLEGWKNFLAVSAARIKLIEHRVASEQYQYAGTLDRLLDLDGELTICDIKAGDPPAAAALQTAAYRRALHETEGILACRRIGVRISMDGTYQVHEYKDHAGDERLFLMALTLARWKKENT